MSKLLHRTFGFNSPSDPTKSSPSASKTNKITESGSSVGSSSEANSPVSLTSTKDMIEAFEEFDETRGKIDKEASTKTRDSSRDFAIESSGVPKSVHQFCIIITEAAEEGKKWTCKSKNRGVAAKRKKTKFTFQQESGESS
jgi:hypothetical protein